MEYNISELPHTHSGLCHMNAVEYVEHIKWES